MNCLRNKLTDEPTSILKDNEIMEDILRNIWGKTDPYHPLINHLIDVGCMAYQLMSSRAYNPLVKRVVEIIGVEEDRFRAWLSYLIAMHDIGKCYPEFQVLGGGVEVGRLREKGLVWDDYKFEVFYHSEQGAVWIKRYLRGLGWSSRAADFMSKVILGHHGYFKVKKNRIDGKLNERWEAIRDYIRGRVLELFRIPGLNREEFERVWVIKAEEIKGNGRVARSINFIGMVILGLLVLSDWVASNNYIYKYSDLRENTKTIESYFSESMRRAIETVDRLGLNNIMELDKELEFEDIFPDFKELTLIQQMIKNLIRCVPEILNVPNLMIIEASTGSGKTEAALYYMAELLSRGLVTGFYFALPTIATSNQIFYRVKDYIGVFNRSLKRSIRLVHGMSWIVDYKPYKMGEESSDFFRGLNVDIENEQLNDDLNISEYIYEWFAPKKRALLSPYAVGTIDQALLSVLNVKFGFLRLFGLSKNVIIVDEVHAYDEYMTSILERLLEWASYFRVPVILLSATIPEVKKKKLMEAYLYNLKLMIKAQRNF